MIPWCLSFTLGFRMVHRGCWRDSLCAWSDSLVFETEATSRQSPWSSRICRGLSPIESLATFLISICFQVYDEIVDCSLHISFENVTIESINRECVMFVR